jgi:phosphoglycolate phosphatase-like HAD superfamily hydrolase
MGNRLTPPVAFPARLADNEGMYVCLFDIDGTLISSGGAGKAALERALASEVGIDRPIERLQLSGRTDRAIIGDLFAMHGLAASPENLQRLLAGYLRHLPGCLASHPGRILPGIAALLDQLRGRDGVAVGLLTGNVRDGARLKLGHFGIGHHFAFGGFGDLHLDRDDVAREALEAVHGRFNGTVSPERIWVIGDTPLDIGCARCIGARVAAVTTGWHTRSELAAAGPDLLLDDLTDPSALLAMWR